MLRATPCSLAAAQAEEPARTAAAAARRAAGAERPGRPMRFPSRRARASPSRVRSLMKVPLELGDRGEHAEDEPARRVAARADVDPLARADEPDAAGVQVADVREDVEGGAPEPVELPDGDGVDFSAPRGVHHALEPRPVVPRAGAGLLDLEDELAEPGGRRAKLLAREGRVLVESRGPATGMDLQGRPVMDVWRECSRPPILRALKEESAMRNEDLARWTKLVADYESSDLSQREFAQEAASASG